MYYQIPTVSMTTQEQALRLANDQIALLSERINRQTTQGNERETAIRAEILDWADSWEVDSAEVDALLDRLGFEKPLRQVEIEVDIRATVLVNVLDYSADLTPSAVRGRLNDVLKASEMYFDYSPHHADFETDSVDEIQTTILTVTRVD